MTNLSSICERVGTEVSTFNTWSNSQYFGGFSVRGSDTVYGLRRNMTRKRTKMDSLGEGRGGYGCPQNVKIWSKARSFASEGRWCMLV